MERLKRAAFSLVLGASIQMNAAVLEQQELQLAKGITMLYADMQEKGDDSKKEYRITDPEFIIDLKPLSVVVNSNLKGSLNVILDYKNNKLHAESDGINHIIVNEIFKYPKKGKDSQEIADYTLEGKIIKDMTVDFNQAKQSLSRLSEREFNQKALFDKLEGKIRKDMTVDFNQAKQSLSRLSEREFNQEALFELFSSIKDFSSSGSDIKVSGTKGYGKELIDYFKYNYKHTSGDSPEDMSFNIKRTDDNGVHGQEIPVGNYVYRFPGIGALTSVHNFSAQLPAWKKISDFLRTENLNDISTWSMNFSGEDNSKIMTGSWKGSTSSVKEQENALKYQHQASLNSNMSQDWVSAVQKFTKEPIQGKHEEPEPEDALLEGFFQWLASSKTTPFLHLLPLDSNIDTSATMNYTAIPLSVKNFNGYVSWLSKQKGIKVNFNYDGGVLKSQLDVMGGKPVFDHGVELYNALSDSMTSVIIMPKLSSTARDDLYKILLKYAEDSAKADSEMKFLITYDDNGIMVGKKSFYNLLSDLAQFREKHFSSEANNY